MHSPRAIRVTVQAHMAGACLGRVKPVSILMPPPLMLAAPTACLALTLLPIPHTHTHSQSQEALTLPDCPAASVFPVQLPAFPPDVPSRLSYSGRRYPRWKSSEGPSTSLYNPQSNPSLFWVDD